MNHNYPAMGVYPYNQNNNLGLLNCPMNQIINGNYFAQNFQNANNINSTTNNMNNIQNFDVFINNPKNNDNNNALSSFDFYQQFANMKIQTPANAMNRNENINGKNKKRKYFNKTNYFPSLQYFQFFSLIFNKKENNKEKHNFFTQHDKFLEEFPTLKAINKGKTIIKI